MNKSSFLLITLVAALFTSCKHITIQQPVMKVVEGGMQGSADTSTVVPLMGQSLVIAVIFIVMVLILAQAVYRLENQTWKKVWALLEAHLSKLFVFAWLFGFAVYAVGMFVGIDETPNAFERFKHLFWVAPMAVIHAFEMFAFQSDVSAVHGEFHESLVYMALFSAAHFLAAFVSLIFVIKHFGYTIVTSVQMWLAAHGWNKYDEVFVFWGMNDASLQLAKNIKTCGKVQGKFLTIIVQMSDDDAKVENRTGFDRLLNFLSMRNEELEKIKEIGCLTTNAFTSLAKLSEPNDNQRPDFIYGKMRLGNVVKIIKNTTGDIHLLFLSDDDKGNIRAVGNIKRDSTITQLANNKQEGKIKIYCHARYNSVHRVIEDEQSNEKVQIMVVDSSHIHVELMKQKVELQPVSYVKVEDDATVSSQFNALIVGFSEVGLDAMRFLYEFGAFVKTGSTKDKVERSPFHCDVVDKKMDELAGLFVANAPSIPIDCDFSTIRKDRNPLITLHKWDAQSLEFTDFLKRKLEGSNSLNYIVVATENDEMNISVGVRIMRLAIRYRDNMEKLRIMVRVHHDENKHILHIAEHYNRLWAAEGKSDNKRIHQKEITSDAFIGSPITLFGSEDSTYTYDNIISEEIEGEAKSYKERYDHSKNAQLIASALPPEKIKTWDDEQNELMQLNETYKGFSPTFSGVMRLRRVQSQNKENCLHMETKRTLAQTALGDETMSMLSSHKITRESNTIEYRWTDGSIVDGHLKRVLDVLAWTEHLRWNASHEVLGYRTSKDRNVRDEAKLIHWCLRPWQDLKHEETESYDYDVVDVSLGII